MPTEQWSPASRKSYHQYERNQAEARRRSRIEAAAPEMLDALKKARLALSLHQGTGPHQGTGLVLAVVEAAIEKAEPST
jgi:hypothetical protein